MNIQNKKEYVKKCYTTLTDQYPELLELDEELREEGIFIPKEMQTEGNFDKWRYCETSLTEEELVDFENRHQITLPNTYKMYLTSFGHLLNKLYGRLDGYFGEELEALVYIPPQPYGSELKYVDEIYSECEILVKNGYLPLGDFNSWGPLCIDISKSEEEEMKVLYFDHEEYGPCNSREELEQIGIVLFANFTEFLECFFEGKTHDCDL